MSGIVKVIILASLISTTSLPVIHPQSYQTTDSLSFMETVIISIDRSLYLSGDELRIMAWIAEADNYLPSALSSIIRVEITDREGNTIVREKLDASTGIAEHILRIPETVRSGWYQVRAYTNWMRNFSSSFFSSRNIRIVNSSDLANVNPGDESGSVVIRVIPEGQGPLTNGIVNRCALRVADLSGNPISLKGALVNSMNDTITTFASGKTGWGEIAFIPEIEESYHFTSLIPGISVAAAEMPKINHNRLTFTLARSDSGVDAEFIFKGRNESGQHFLVVHSLYTVYWFRQLDLKNGVLVASVPAEALPDGSILQFSVVDNRNTTVAARLWLNGEVSGRGGYISVSEKSVQPRTSASVRYETDNHRSPGIYNLVVRKKEPCEFNELYIPGLPGWPCTSEIPASSKEREAWLMATLYPNSVINLFLTDSDTSPPLYSINNLTDTYHLGKTIAEFPPETRGMVVSGKTIRGETLTLTTFSDNFVYTAISQPSGSFHFVLPNTRQEHDAVISFIGKPKTGLGIQIRPEYDSSLPDNMPLDFSLSEDELDYLRDLSINRQITDIFSQSVVSDSSEVTTQQLQVQNRHFGYPDYSVYVDNYIRLPNIRELIAEVVPTVVARKSGDNWELRIINEKFGMERLMPLVLLDGLPLTNFNEFLVLPSERIRKIDIFNDFYIHGNATFGGIIYFVSNNKDLAGMTLPEESKLITLSMPRHTSSGDQFSIPSELNTPVLPTVLTNLTLGNVGWGSLNVPVSDNLGEFIVSMTGFTSLGRWVNHSALFVVERKTIKK